MQIRNRQSISGLIYVNDLQPADVIIARKIGIGLLDHYVVYLGRRADGQHYFAANLGTSVSIMTPSSIGQLTSKYGPTNIRKFQGTKYERRMALERAMKKFRQGKPYNLLTNNCEHYANYVQRGTEYSQQATVAYGGLAAAGFTTAMMSKNPLLRLLGLAIGVGGTVAAINEEASRPSPAQKRLAPVRINLIN